MIILQGISADITAHETAYEKVRAECSDLMTRGVGDCEELQRNLDNLQQRWNAVQVSRSRVPYMYMYVYIGNFLCSKNPVDRFSRNKIFTKCAYVCTLYIHVHVYTMYMCTHCL